MTCSYATASSWSSFACSPQELRLDTSLRCGQCFRWKVREDEEGQMEYSMAFKDRVVSLRQDSTRLYYRTFWPEEAKKNAQTNGAAHGKHESDQKPTVKTLVDTETLLRKYLALDIHLEKLYEQWCKADANFEKKAGGGQGRFAGIRMLAQDPFENLISFICSSNNNIKRITQMVEKLCLHYGRHLLTLHGKEFHAFPEPGALAVSSMERDLRDLGFGYRAKFIQRTATKLVEDHPAIDGADTYLASLHSSQGVTYWEAKEALMQFDGVGPKVADCILLMSLGHHGSIPVDTHLWQIATRDYGFRAKGGGKGTLTPVLYDAVGERFRQVFGPFAGWAHSVLFCADLSQFRNYEQVKLPITPVKDHSIGMKEESPSPVATRGDYNGASSPDRELKLEGKDLEIGATAVVANDVKTETVIDSLHTPSKRRKRRR